MAVKIPQNIEREDKLVGPLTLKQFLYVLGGSAVVFLAFQYYNLGYLFFHEFVIIGTIGGGLAISFAFLSINGRPFPIFIIHLASFMGSSKTRLWRKTADKEALPLKLTDASMRSSASSTEAIPSQSELEKLALVLDTGGKIKTDASFTNAHIINTVPQNTAANPEFIEADLNVEDIFKQTDL